MADELNDNDLFQNATADDTLEKFNNPELPLDLPELPPTPAPPEPAPDKVADKVEPKEEALVPAHRLREESEARRQAERRYEELLTRQAQQLQQPPPPPPQPSPPTDIFDNPSEFVSAIAKQQFTPYLEQIRADLQMQREGMSLDWAIRLNGNDRVLAARQALEQGLSRGENDARDVYTRAMSSHDPYGVIVKWHNDGEVLRTTKGDLTTYRQSVLDEALKDPEYQKKMLDTLRGTATATRNSIAVPAKPTASSSPSLGDIGAGGVTDNQVEPSDEELFRAVTSAKRR